MTCWLPAAGCFVLDTVTAGLLCKKLALVPIYKRLADAVESFMALVVVEF
jgi:hypothetical protein